MQTMVEDVRGWDVAPTQITRHPLHPHTTHRLNVENAAELLAHELAVDVHGLGDEAGRSGGSGVRHDDVVPLVAGRRVPMARHKHRRRPAAVVRVGRLPVDVVAVIVPAGAVRGVAAHAREARVARRRRARRPHHDGVLGAVTVRGPARGPAPPLHGPVRRAVQAREARARRRAVDELRGAGERRVEDDGGRADGADVAQRRVRRRAAADEDAVGERHGARRRDVVPGVRRRVEVGRVQVDEQRLGDLDRRRGRRRLRRRQRRRRRRRACR